MAAVKLALVVIAAVVHPVTAVTPNGTIVVRTEIVVATDRNNLGAIGARNGNIHMYILNQTRPPWLPSLCSLHQQ